MKETVEEIKKIRKFPNDSNVLGICGRRIAYMNQDGLWGYLNGFGRVIVKPQYYQANDYVGCMAYVIDKTYNSYKDVPKLLDISGNQLNYSGMYGTPKDNISKGYVSAFGLIDSGLSPITNKHKYILIDVFGRIYKLPSNIDIKEEDLANFKVQGNDSIIFKNELYIDSKGRFKRVPLPFNQNNALMFEDFVKNPEEICDFYSIVHSSPAIDNKKYGNTSYEDCIINRHGERIISLPNYRIKRLSDKYYLATKSINTKRYEDKNYEFKETVIFYITDTRKSKNRIDIVFNSSNDSIKDAKVIDDKYIIITFYGNHKAIYTISNSLFTEVYDDIKYKDGNDYFVCKRDNGTYDYYDKKLNKVRVLDYYINFNKKIGFYITKEKSDASNNVYTYNKYHICNSGFNEVYCIPNEHFDIKLRSLKHVGNLLVGQSLFSKRCFVINPFNKFKTFDLDCDSYEYVNGYFILNKKEKYSLVDSNGNVIFNDYDKIINLGENEILIQKGLENKIIILDNMYRLDVVLSNENKDYIEIIEYSDGSCFYTINIDYFDKLLEEGILDNDNVLIEIKQSGNELSTKEFNPDIPVQKSMILISTKELINKIGLSSVELLESNPNSLTDKIIKVKDKYKKYLKYFDLSSLDCSLIDLNGLDLDDTNIPYEYKEEYRLLRR